MNIIMIIMNSNSICSSNSNRMDLYVFKGLKISRKQNSSQFCLSASTVVLLGLFLSFGWKQELKF